jgi:hypothetical protein
MIQEEVMVLGLEGLGRGEMLISKYGVKPRAAVGGLCMGWDS